MLASNEAHTAIAGPVRLVNLGEHVLGLAGYERRATGPARKLIGSGGVIIGSATSIRWSLAA